MRSKALGIMIAAALGAGIAATNIAGAQTSPGANRQPGGAPDAGDTRATPGPDRKLGPAPRTSEQSPQTTTPGDRKINPAGEPNAGDTRAIPGRDPAASRRKGDDWDRTQGAAPQRSGSDLGTPEKRPDGPDAGVPQSGVKP